MGKTSWQVKAKYNKKAYKSLSVQLKPDLYNEFENLREINKMSKPEFIRELINVYSHTIKKREKDE